MDKVHHLPARSSPRLATSNDRPLPDASINHRARELQATVDHLTAATHCMLATDMHGCESALDDASAALEGALFHALTLAGARNADKALRDLLLQRINARQGGDHAG